MEMLKNKLFYIYFLILVASALSPFLIYINHLDDDVQGCVELKYTNLDIETLKQSETEIKYKSISIYPEYDNFLCLGRIIEYEVLENNNIITYKAFNDQLFTSALHLILFIFFISPFFKVQFKNFYIHFQVFQILFFIFYIYFILYKFDFYGYNIEKFEPSYLLFLVFLINSRLNKQDHIGLVIQFTFFALFGTKFIGLIIVYLILQNDSQILRNFERFKMFIYLPILRYLLIFVSSLSEQLDFLWMSLIELPHSGLARFYDLQWNLVSLICEKNPNYSSPIYFSDASNTLVTSRSCPSDLYSPIYEYLSFTFNVRFAYILVMGVLFIILSLIYFKLINKDSDNKYMIVFLFLSPPLNFLIYQGNLDLLCLIAISSIVIWKFPYFWKVALVTFVGLLELHPLAFLVGLFFHSVLKQDLKKILTNVFFMSISVFLIYVDNSEWSVRNWKSSVGFGYIQSSSYNISFGVSSDYSLIFGTRIGSINAIILYIFFSLIIIYLTRKESILNNKMIGTIHQEDYFGFTFWFWVILLYENFSYRLAMFTLFFYFTYITNTKRIKILVIMSIFLTPTSLVEFSLLEYSVLIIGKISLYSIGLLSLNLIYLEARKILKKRNKSKI
jgi:hypothetical protein